MRAWICKWVCVCALECAPAWSKDHGSMKRLSYTKHRCCLGWFNESECLRLRHLSKCVYVCVFVRVCAYVVLMFWMSIGGKTCVENSAELRQGSHKSLSLSLALVFSFPSPLSRFALSTMCLLWWLAVVWDSSPPCLFSTHRCDKLLSRCLQVCGVPLFIPLCLLSVYFQWYLFVLVSTYKEIVYCITEGFSFFCSCNKEANASSNTGVWSLILNITLPHWKNPCVSFLKV